MKTKSTPFCLLFFLCAILSIRVKAQAVNVQDSLALVDLYNSTNGDAWYHHQNWLSGPVSTWDGITLNHDRVTRINLTSNHMVGNIPLSMGSVTELEVLDLFDNQISGSIPSVLGNLANLQTLSLSNNQLSSSIPSSLGNLVYLTQFDLNGNQLSGSIPPSLGNLINLEYLGLISNKLSGTIPPELGNLVHVTELYLGDNQLSGNIIPEFANDVNLYSLGLEHNYLTGSIPPALGTLPLLTWLDLQNNQLTGIIPPELGNLISLWELNLSNNQLTGTIPPALGNLPSLIYPLDLSHNQLTGSIPPSLGNLVQIQGLALNNNQLTGRIPSSFNNFSVSKLHFLHLENNHLRGDVSVLANIALGDLDISYNRFTFSGMEVIAQKFPFAVYDKQKRIPLHLSNNTLSISAGGTLSNNTYHWYGANHNGYASEIISGDSVFHPTKSGIYYVRVFNSIATELTLRSDTIYYKVPNVTTSSENAIQTNGNKAFIVYPIPAKDVIHIKTNGSSSLTLTNQEGKLMTTVTINGKGFIVVSSFAPGVYYLRNNTSHEMQKVVVVK